MSTGRPFHMQLGRHRRWLGAACAAVLLWSCGGGTNVATVGTGGTGSFSVGVVTGFGSVIVNGQRFDDSQASVRDADGQRSKDDLQLGMVVRVEGSVNSSGSASAASIEFDSELLGPVSSVGSSTFTVLGQKVATHTGTVYAAELRNGFASIQNGDLLEVHGFLQPATNELQATLVSLKTSANEFKLSGLVKSLQSASKTFAIGSLSISYASAKDVPNDLRSDLPVKLRLSNVAPGPGQPWQATRVRVNKDALADKGEAEIEGVITAFTNTASFSIGNVPVDAGRANFKDGSSAVTLGTRVEAKGSLVGGVLVAREVKLEDDGDKVELKGALSAVNTSAKTFSLRGQSIVYSASTVFKGGTEANLANGRRVEVKASLSATSATLTATEIEFE
jgi:hypothetical protein